MMRLLICSFTIVDCCVTVCSLYILAHFFVMQIPTNYLVGLVVECLLPSLPRSVKNLLNGTNKESGP